MQTSNDSRPSWTTSADGRYLGAAGVALSSPLRALPLTRWATRFEGGSVHLTGLAPAPVTFLPGLELPAGPVALEMRFVGGISPEVRELRCVASPVVLTIVERKLSVAGQEVPAPAPLAAVEGLLDHLHDLSVHVEASAGNELWVKLAPGVAATIPARATITVDAATRGPPSRPRLQRSLVVSVGGAGLCIRLPGSRWLKALASVSIRGASLAPDGEVELTGHTGGTLDRVVGAGLRKTSSHLSDLVRRSPQFAQFLGTEED